MATFNDTIMYRKGASNGKVDALSRNPAFFPPPFPSLPILSPTGLHIHPMFHVNLLEPHVANKFPGRVVAPPPPDHVDSYPEFEVDRILNSKIRRGKIMYLVDSVGYDAIRENLGTYFSFKKCHVSNRRFPF